MERIKILEVIGSLKIGGAEKIAADISSHIDKTKYQVDYLVYDEVTSEHTNLVEKNGSHIYRLKMDSANPLKMHKTLKTFFNGNKFDIIHAHMMFHNGIVLHAAKKAGIKHLISHAHSADDGKDQKSIINSLYKAITKKILCGNRIIRVACGEKAGLCLYGKKYLKDGVLFNNRIDCSKFSFDVIMRDTIRQQLKINNDEDVFLIVGHLVPLKNHTLAFEAFKKFNEQQQNSSLYVLGDGYLLDSLKEYVALNKLSKNIIFTGNVKNVNEYMLASDHLLMPSWYEGFPVTLVEAQCGGLHCIVSDRITKEIELTDLISWCSIDNSDGWVEAMKKRYERKDLSSQIKEKGFDYSNYGEWLNNFYNL